MSLYRDASFTAITVGQFNRLESWAIHYDWNLAFDGRSRGNLHLARTVKLIKYLWHGLHENDELKKNTAVRTELDVAIAGGLLHDIGLVKGNCGHCFSGKIIAGGILMNAGLEKEIIDRILHCIEAHDGEVPALTVEAQLVHDADTIDKLGPLGAIRHIWKLSLLGEREYTSEELEVIIPDHLESRYRNLYLNESKELAGKLITYQKNLFENSEIFNKIVNYIVLSAKSGRPVDEMIFNLIDDIKFNSKLEAVVKKQLEADLHSI